MNRKAVVPAKFNREIVCSYRKDTVLDQVFGTTWGYGRVFFPKGVFSSLILALVLKNSLDPGKIIWFEKIFINQIRMGGHHKNPPKRRAKSIDAISFLRQ